MPKLPDKILICATMAIAQAKLALRLSREIWKIAKIEKNFRVFSEIPDDLHQAYGKCMDTFVGEMETLNKQFDAWIEQRVLSSKKQ